MTTNEAMAAALRDAVTAALDAADLADILRGHQASYDHDCTEHYGCTCGELDVSDVNYFQCDAEVAAHQADVIRAAILAKLT